MSILQAFGIGIMIGIIKILLPEIFTGTEGLVVKTLSVSSDLLTMLQASIGSIDLPPSL